MLLGRTGHERGALVRSASQTLQTSVVGTPAERFAAARTPMVAPPPQVARFGTVALRYLAGAPILVRGPATRTEYPFSRATRRYNRVAQADAAALIASGHFRRES